MTSHLRRKNYTERENFLVDKREFVVPRGGKRGSDKASGERTERSARLAQTAKRFASSRRRRRSAGEARRQTRVSKRDREKSAGFGSGTVANQSA
jgi:hypothetical protein